MKLKLNRKVKLKIAAAVILALIVIVAVVFFAFFSFYRAMTEARTSLALATYSRDKQVVSRGETRDRTVIVAPGDTLWDIANRYYPGVDARKVVWALKVANGLMDAGTLAPGMRLRLPVEVSKGVY